ncbi:hypothetical protein Ahy_A02g009694 [Arachis hypogaea]|uniref:Uncharacterized protein n=1 Tax=Arachis hypogaea TaxID=3818 RepID=A0A445EHS8_ARAHY|nr:hypothetical protein Ahy_A02g009694 [Arachis hypogaea]
MTMWMESECDKLIMVVVNKNHIDIDVYPFTIELQSNFLFYSFHSLKKCRPYFF